MKNSRLILLFLTILSGCLLLYHRTLYQPLVAPGDHGRDFYAFEATMNGQMPYRDYWWVYGPLMPYYYALIYKFLGTNMHAILVGRIILDLFSGLFFFLILSSLDFGLLAYIGALWFWAFNPDFFFTYNHAGGITMLLGITYTLFCYLQKPQTLFLKWGLASIFLLSLIKVNFGLATLAGYLACVFLIDRVNRIPFTKDKKLFYAFAIFILPPLIFISYLPFVQGLSSYEIRQCLPYLKGDQPYSSSMITSSLAWFNATIMNSVATWPLVVISTVVLLCVAHTIYWLTRPSTEKTHKKTVILSIVILLILFVVNFHEYLVSGVFYRSFWTKPFSGLLFFVVLGFAFRHLNKIIRLLPPLLLTWLVFLNFSYEWDIVQHARMPEDYLTMRKGQIYVGNSEPWVTSVKQTVDYIDTHVPKNETFFALPYDPLYYFLADKKSPTRQLIFFEHINIPQEQEYTVINELESHHVNYVLVSSRANAREHGLGRFGETYCPVLGKYLQENFQTAAAFGDWVNEPGWAWNHGTMILKRK